MDFENHNPWGVPSIDSFNFLCCPECSFRSKEESNFQSHALQNHPKSKIFFKPKEILPSEEKNLNFCYCCPECTYKSENLNLFQIHALQNHPLSVSFFMRENTNSDSGNS